MNVKNKPAQQTIFIAIIFLVGLLGWTIWQFHFNYMISLYDTFFHTQRIYEIRLAFLHHALPSWVNFNTFFNTGQAVNGMYPDLTLWPFVLVTNFLTPIHQIIAIKSLIALLTFIVTFLSLNKRFESRNAVLAAIIFTLSGSVLKDLANEMQTGTAIIMIFAFPILFTLKDAIESKKVEPRLIIKTALLMTIVINSHLLSAVVITIIAGIFLIVITVIRKNYQAWLNLAIAAFLTVLLSAPLLYRIVKISKTGLLAPFGKGHVTSESLWNIFSTTSWSAKSTISEAAIVLIVITLIGIKLDKIKQLLPWLSLELLLIIFCTNILPWDLLSHLPVINTFQAANWRFGIFLGIAPLITVLINFKEHTSRIILLILAVLSFILAFRNSYNFQYYHTANLTVVNKYTSAMVPPNDTVKLTSTGINSNKLSRTLLPDYVPNSAPLQKGSNGASFDPQLSYLITNQLGTTKTKDIPLTHTTTVNSITFKAHNVPKGAIGLPVFGYRTLKYKITLNGKPITAYLNNYGLITIDSQNSLKHANYKIEFIQPTLYKALLWMSTILFLVLLIGLTVPIKKFSYLQIS